MVLAHPAASRHLIWQIKLKHEFNKATVKDFQTKNNIFQNELVLGTNTQNKKQSKMFKVHEKLKKIRKNFDEQTKGTSWKKSFDQALHQWLTMRINFKEKKLDKDRHRTKHKVFIWHYRPKTLRSKDTEISTQPSFEAFCKTKGWKGSCLNFFGSETEKK